MVPVTWFVPFSSPYPRLCKRTCCKLPSSSFWTRCRHSTSSSASFFSRSSAIRAMDSSCRRLVSPSCWANLEPVSAIVRTHTHTHTPRVSIRLSSSSSRVEPTDRAPSGTGHLQAVFGELEPGRGAPSSSRSRMNRSRSSARTASCRSAAVSSDFNRASSSVCLICSSTCNTIHWGFSTLGIVGFQQGP
jgi:hypothetical protein